MRTAIPRGITNLTHQRKVLNDKKTMEESFIEAENHDRNVSKIAERNGKK